MYTKKLYIPVDLRASAACIGPQRPYDNIIKSLGNADRMS
jgi:hypothetical protein